MIIGIQCCLCKNNNKENPGHEFFNTEGQVEKLIAESPVPLERVNIIATGCTMCKSVYEIRRNAE